MSGIRTGTRLEQLEALRRRVHLQIQHALIHDQPTGQLAALRDRLDQEIKAERRASFVVVPRQPPNRVDQLLTQLGVTAHDVKVWAVEHGLLDKVRRGRIALRYVEAYAAHQQLAELLATGYARRKEPQP